MQAITKVFSEIVKPYIDTVKQTLTQQINVSDAKNLCPTMNPSDPLTLESWSNYFKINADGSITANGTPPGRVSIASRVVLPAGQYIMNGCPSGGNWNSYRIMFLKYTPSETVVYADAGSTPTTVTLDEETEVVIRVDLYGNYTASNIVYKPMICLKSAYDLDPSYAPPAKTNQQLTKETAELIDNQNVNGVVNMLPLSFTTQVISNLTITRNNDDTITVSAPSYPYTIDNGGNNITFAIGTFIGDGKTYKLSGCPSDGGDSSYEIYLNPSYKKDEGNGLIFAFVNGTSYNVRIALTDGYTLTKELTFKPMITVPFYKGDYVPYAKSNRELTELTSQLALSVISGNAGTVFNISCDTPYARALVITPYSIGSIAYWSGTFHYIPLAVNQAITVASSNESSTGLTLTFSSVVNITIMSLTNQNDIWSGTKVS